jgi:hypothetical protein
LEHRVLLSAQNVLSTSLTMLPGTSFDDVPVQFRLTQDQAAYTEIGVFQLDADGTLGGLTPGSEGFNEAVLKLSSRQVLFTQASPIGSSAMGTFLGGRQIGIYFCTNLPPIDGNQFQTQTSSTNMLNLGFEETLPVWPAVSNVLGAESRRFDDAMVQTTIGVPVRFPVPILAPIGEQTIPELQPFQLIVTAQNPAGPDSDLRYQLDQAPEGVAIDALSGRLTWTPTESQAPGRYDIVVRAFNVNRPESFTTQRFVINVTEVNSAPMINPIMARDARQLQQLSFIVSAMDPDLPRNQLTFSLDDNGVQGATINPTTGRFTWTPSLNDAPGTYVFTIRVVDNGSPALGNFAMLTVLLSPAV